MVFNKLEKDRYLITLSYLRVKNRQQHFMNRIGLYRLDYMVAKENDDDDYRVSFEIHYFVVYFLNFQV